MSLWMKDFGKKETRAEMKKRIEAIGAKEVLYYLDTPMESNTRKGYREEIIFLRVNLS